MYLFLKAAEKLYRPTRHYINYTSFEKSSDFLHDVGNEFRVTAKDADIKYSWQMDDDVVDRD
jgi:hypothetical protein